MGTLQFVMQYARNYRRALAYAIASMLVLVALDLVGPLVIRKLITVVEDPAQRDTALQTIAGLAILYLFIGAARWVFEFINSYQGHVAGWGVVADTRRLAYTHLQRLSLRFYEDQKTGDLMSRVVNDTNLFEAIIAHAIPNTLVNVLTLIGVSTILTMLNWRLMALTLIPIPFIVIAMRVYAIYVRPAFRDRQKVLADLNANINDNISGIREIKAFNQEPSAAHKISQGIDAYRDSLLRALRLMATFNPFVQFTSQIGYIIVIYFGGRLAFQNTLPVADLVAFFLYLDRFYGPVRSLAGSWEQVQEALAGADRVAELLDEDPEVYDKADALIISPHAEGHLRFNDVSFSYTPGEPVLQHVDLDIPAGSVVALVGPTGVGKTTMASLIPRFYDVTEGSLTLDGTDVRDIALSSLRREISIVLQDVFLFHGTVRDNILFGRPDATEEEVIAAAKVANAHDFIMEDLSEGYDTIIGERGVKLSGGQKQRLSIARAVLKDAPILILDEATSSVDTETELQIQEALDRLTEGRTTVIIAHRLSTIRNADRIVVLSADGIAESGTHFELMARGGMYRHLVEAQNRATGILESGDINRQLETA